MVKKQNTSDLTWKREHERRDTEYRRVRTEDHGRLFYIYNQQPTTNNLIIPEGRNYYSKTQNTQKEIPKGWNYFILQVNGK